MPMTKIERYTTLSFIGLGLLITCLGLSSCRSGNRKNGEHKGEVFVRYEIIPGRTGGWGYALFADDKPYIKQDVIPAINGIHTFKSKEDAEKVAKLVRDKLHNRQSPAVDSLELVKLGIAF
jgi:hypothetical protein